MTGIDIDEAPDGWTDADRSDVVRSCRTADQPYANALVDIARMAALSLQAPVAAIGLRGRRGMVLAASVGVQTSRTLSWEADTILAFFDQQLRRDYTDDAGVALHRSLTDANSGPYSGTVLRTPDGHPIGTIGVLGRAAHDLTKSERDMLGLLARQAMAILETGRASVRQSRDLEERRVAYNHRRTFEWLAKQSPDLVGLIDFAGYFQFLNDSGRQLIGLAPNDYNPYTLGDLISEEDRDVFWDEVKPIIRRGEPCERRLRITPVGTRKPLPTAFTIFPVRNEEGRIVGYGLRSKDDTDQEAEEQRREHLIREGHHRIGNMISLINSIASLTIRNSATLEDAARSIRSRLDALGAAQTTLGAAKSATIEHVVTAALRAVDFGRIELSGPSLLLTAEQVQGLSLLLYELATNAVKYGSLSNEEGRVTLSWSLSAGKSFTFGWKELGGPPVVAPTSQGFGSTLVNRGIGRYFDGDVEQRFLAEGVQVRLRGWLKGDLNPSWDLETSPDDDLVIA